ncbi:hypothetical protein TWF506_008459 [Arthrobotrys conoides]|uniref:Uncharacterized protein n=1 Tax=Arthrobotrys conoides TaxID=74498 RepID=A0AAN8N5Z5_9PEZI
MHSLLLPLLVLPSVLGGCARFSTNDRWTVRTRIGDGYATGYQFLEDGPVIQTSRYITCNEEYITQSQCRGNSSLCRIEVEGGASASARFSVQPTTNNNEALMSFFGTVKKAVGANGPGDEAVIGMSPQYQACGNVGGPSRSWCIASGDSAWVRYYPEYLCVSGTTEECTDGPFESGTELVVCGIGRLPSGDVTLLSNRTIGEGAQSYTASDVNPALDNTCSMGVAVFELKGWSFWLMGLAIIAGFIL